ncbi:MAG: HigA family addiction module antidote protein [Anaerolineales bacterium]|nr:HigA family addiction module antidote protein [Anaerolineales bacterium]
MQFIHLPKNRRPTSPGTILQKEFLEPLGLSVEQFAEEMKLPLSQLTELIHEQRPLTPDLAERLAERLGTTAAF